MIRLKLIFVLVLFIMVNKSVSAQQTIITDISEEYIARLIAHAEANYPMVKSNESRIEIAAANIDKAKVGYLSSFSFSYVYQPQGISGVASPTSTYSAFNGIQAGVFFNLGTFLTVPYTIKAAKRELEIAQNDQNMYFLTLSNQIRSRYYTYVGDIAILKLATQATIDAQNVCNDIKHKFEKGEETYDNYTKSQTSLTASFQAKIQAETAVLIAKANIEELLGEKLENIR